MAEAKLRVTIPDQAWVSELSREFPGATVRVLAAIPHEKRGVGLAEITSRSLERFLSQMRSCDGLEAVTVLDQSDQQALVQFETLHPLLLDAARSSGIPLSTPFEIADGEATWELQSPRDRLSALGERLDERGIEYTLESVQGDIESEPLLTDTQRAVVWAALERGYYETPRQCSLDDLSDELDLATSTVGETLQRAEGRIVAEFARSHRDGPESV